MSGADARLESLTVVEHIRVRSGRLGFDHWLRVVVGLVVAAIGIAFAYEARADRMELGFITLMTSVFAGALLWSLLDVFRWFELVSRPEGWHVAWGVGPRTTRRAVLAHDRIGAVHLERDSEDGGGYHIRIRMIHAAFAPTAGEYALGKGFRLPIERLLRVCEAIAPGKVSRDHET